MEKLTIFELAPYLPYGLQCQTKGDNSKQIWIMGTENIKHALKWWKPLLIPLSELTAFMPTFIKELSKLCLDDCTYEQCEYEEDINQWWVNAFDGDKVLACLTFDGNAFYIQYWHGNADDSFNAYEPQYVALNILAKYHIDYMGLIDAGLAINKLLHT